jgi:hypothetical protein
MVNVCNDTEVPDALYGHLHTAHSARPAYTSSSSGSGSSSEMEVEKTCLYTIRCLHGTHSIKITGIVAVVARLHVGHQSCLGK